MPRDSKNLTDAVEYFDPLSEEQKARARMTVCHNAESVSDAIDLMFALGIHPTQNEDLSRVGPIQKINEGSRG